MGSGALHMVEALSKLHPGMTLRGGLQLAEKKSLLPGANDTGCTSL